MKYYKVKKKSILIRFIIFLILLSIVKFPVISFSKSFDQESNSNENTYNLTFDDWKLILLNYNNISIEDYINFPNSIKKSLDVQASIYQGWANGTYSDFEKSILLIEALNTPQIDYSGPQNYPIEGIDLKSYNDKRFQLKFLLSDNTVNERILRVYAYLDYDREDTILADSERFFDGSTVKHYEANEVPSFETLNPDFSFMGENATLILNDYKEWTLSEEYYDAIKNLPNKIDDSIFFHVKTLYKTNILENEGWYSYYYYKNYYLSWYWSNKLELRPLKIIDDDTSPPNIQSITILNSPINENSENISIKINTIDLSGIAELYINFSGISYYDSDKDNIIAIPNPRILGTYYFNVFAVDNDNDRLGDQLTATKSFNFEVTDDDNEAPVIAGLNIANAPIYENSEFVDVEILVEDSSGIAESYIEFMGLKYYDIDGDNHILIPNPGVIGIYGFTVNVTDADIDYEGDQLSSTLTSSFAVIDDDNEAPVIAGVTITNAPIYENSEFVDVEILVEDSSGIAESYIEFMGLKYYDSDGDNHILIPNPGVIGIYSFTVNVTDADMDYEGDQLSSTLISSFEVIDDDIYGPVIAEVKIINSPIYDAYDNVIIDIFLDDASGISELYIEFMGNIYRDYDGDCRIIIPNPINPGIYECKIVAIDADIDHEGDQSNTTIFFNFEVLDDDVIAPIISEINLLNSPIYDSYNEIIIQISAQDYSGISELYIEFMGIIYEDENGDYRISIPNPTIPGNYIFKLIAIDADMEFEGDQSLSEVLYEFQVLDDDTTAPQIFIHKTWFGWNVSIIDNDGNIDSNATGNYLIIDQNGRIWYYGYISQENINYSLFIPLKPGIYTLIVNATNNDIEWDGDEEISEISSQINRTLADCYLYVNNQLEILKNYVDANLYCILAWSIRCKLWLAQENLNNAYELIENGSVTCGLLHDAMAQILIEITEFETEFYHSLSLISDEEAEYVITSLHSIRNNIVYLMGSSVDYSLETFYGYDVASIEVNMLNLKDFIDTEINETDRANLENLIVCAAMKLEMAIFQLSLEDDINETLITALNNLNNAIIEVISLKDSGKISQDLANILLLEINISKNELEFIINSI